MSGDHSQHRETAKAAAGSWPTAFAVTRLLTFLRVLFISVYYITTKTGWQHLLCLSLSKLIIDAYRQLIELGLVLPINRCQHRGCIPNFDGMLRRGGRSMGHLAGHLMTILHFIFKSNAYLSRLVGPQPFGR